METILIPLLILFIGSFFLITILTRGKANRKERLITPTVGEIIRNNPQPQFALYNYLKKSVKVEVIKTSIGTIKPILITTIAPRKSKTVNLSIVERYLVAGNVFRIMVYDEFDPSFVEKEFSVYGLNIPPDEMIKELHIGMMVSKWVGATNDYNVGRNGTAVQGVPWLRMHNLTSMQLAFNENINITPEGVLRYTGRQFMGVALGTLFKDQEDIFPDFVMNIPATDLYIGVTSDLQQGLYGGFQLTPEFYHDEGAPNDMQQLNNLSGPDNPHIVPGFLPIEGPSVVPVNRWGEIV